MVVSALSEAMSVLHHPVEDCGHVEIPDQWARAMNFLSLIVVVDEVAGNVDVDDPTAPIEDHKRFVVTSAKSTVTSTNCCSPP